jgi:hypothetical protein
VPAKPPRPAGVENRVKAGLNELKQLARMAVGGGKQLFTLPPQPIPINGPVRVFYNRCVGPLPPNGQLVVSCC